MVITIGSVKGGVGKSTIATTLAVYLAKKSKNKVVLIDADTQGTSHYFTQLRQEQRVGVPDYQSVQLTGNKLHEEIRSIARDFHDVVVDVGGRDTASQRAALAVSDIYVVPLSLQAFDIWALRDVLDLLEQLRPFNPNLATFFVANRTDYRGAGSGAFNEMATAIKEAYGIDLLPYTLSNRIAYSKAAANGLTVLDPEYVNQEAKAVAEFNTLFQHIIKQRTGK
jgi:chromosome partitioning protein